MAYLTQLYTLLSDDYVSSVLIRNNAALGDGSPVTAEVVAGWKEKADVYSKLISRLEGNGGNGETLWNNLTINPYWHAVESIGTLEAVNSMLMQSQEDVLRLFPAWPASKNAEFTNLRAYGAFLVSAAYDARSRTVTSASVTSEKGRNLVVQSPWSGGT